MAYQALLFCPDEKTARTVTQVLSELEFSVEAFSEPFAAVKKLMAGHYDAVVVDCENEQNGTLLFKSARTSTSNQTSLAVAVVEGQAGVAKAFRIGANLVLTKPINVEQAKGTLRVARGLLRKGDPAKPAAPVAAATPAKPAAVPAAPKPAPLAAKPVAPRPVTPAMPLTPSIPVAKPVQPVIAAQAKPPAPPAADTDDILEVPAVASVPPAPRPIAPIAPSAISASSGAASAPAPARIAPPAIEHPAPASAPASVAGIEFEKPAESSAPSGHAPSFTFGGANAAEEESSGGSKKVIIGVAAAVIAVAGLYFGWTQFHAKSAATSSQSSPVLSAPAPQGEQPKPAPVSSTPAPAPSSTAATTTSSPSSSVPDSAESEPVQDIRIGGEKTAPSPKISAKSSASASVPSTSGKAAASRPEPEPIMVKNGNNAPAQPKAAATEAAAPSMLGIAPASNGSMPNLGVSTAPKPVLQTLNISQGVSQGLLIKRVQPVYPMAALRMHVEGAVQLSAVITKSGNISAVTVLSGEPILAKAAQDAVKQWKYKPYYLNGDPVEIQTQITVNFKLPK